MELEQKLYEAFGVTPETKGAEAGQEGQPPAPGAAAAEEGAKEQEPAAPAQVTEPAGQGAAEETAPHKAAEELSQGGAGTQQMQQTEQERRENAARRRKEEQQALIDAAVARARQEEQARSQAEMDAVLQSVGLNNSITGKPITNVKELKEWKEAYDAAQLQKDLKAGKLTPEGLNQMISNHPVIKQAQEIVQQNQTRQNEQEAAAAQVRITAELQEIQKLDPTIREVKDLLHMPNARAFYEYVNKGLSFKDAFYLANRESLEQRKTEAAKQQAMSNSRSKDHLSAAGAGARGSGAQSVPAAEMAMFRMFNPDATEEQIQAYYNKNKH